MITHNFTCLLTHSVPDFGDRFLANFPFRPRETICSRYNINRYTCYLDEYLTLQLI